MTRKQRMLNAYRGVFSDFVPVSPEFWTTYPARALNLSIMEYERGCPLWYGLQHCFNKFDCEGFGTMHANLSTDGLSYSADMKQLDDDTYRETSRLISGKSEFVRTNIFSKERASWVESHPVQDEADIHAYVDMLLNRDMVYDYSSAIDAYDKVGEDYLLEFNIGLPFFDFFDDAMGFENAIFYFLGEDESVLEKYFELYCQAKLELIRGAVEQTNYESFMIGCNSSCIPLLGAPLWRKWDKRFGKIMADEVHKHGKLIHCHHHGKCMEVVPDYVEIGYDCVCPFERDPGDINDLEDLKTVRRLLDDKVTFNGNVHTIHAMINGTPETVRAQVREIKEAFEGSARFIIGTGDQVCGDTPDENIWAMVEEGRKK